MDLHFNRNAAFTDWIVDATALHEDFVIIDVGVQGGESPRWHPLGDHLIVHGFDAIEEVIVALRTQNKDQPRRYFHHIAAGSADSEKTLYFNRVDPCSSSFYEQGSGGRTEEGKRTEERRTVTVRRLDRLLADGTIPKPDFMKVDVEGFEKDVLLGSRVTLESVLAVEIESNFNISPVYPRGHFATLQELLLNHNMLVFDMNFNRVPRTTFQEALLRKNLPPVVDQLSVGRPATLNVLFCRDPIQEADHPTNYSTPCRQFSVDQLIKIMMIYELYGLNDIALDTARRFGEALSSRIDVDRAIHLLADPNCRMPGAAAQKPQPTPPAWRLGAPVRFVKRLVGGRSSAS
jgi:FkbM family methyltransferase